MKTEVLTRIADLPKVNLLPPEIAERKQLQKIQAGAILATVVALGVVGALYQRGQSRVTDAHRQVDTATQESHRLDTALAGYSDVKATAAQTQAAEALLNQAMATEISWSTYLADLSAILPPRTWLTQVTLNETVPPGTLSSPTLAPASVGNATFQAYGMNYPAVADWLDAFQAEKGFSNIYFSNAAENYIGSTKVVTFSGLVSLTSDALTKRCVTPGSC